MKTTRRWLATAIASSQNLATPLPWARNAQKLQIAIVKPAIADGAAQQNKAQAAR